MMPPTSIDGTDITGATIDGTDVTEITVDGQTVFSAEALPVAYSNLVAWYPFDSSFYGGSNADDVTGILGGSGDDTAYDGTVNGATYQSSGGVTDINAGANSGAFDFDGSNDNIQLPSNAFDSTSTFSLSFWLEADDNEVSQVFSTNDNDNGFRILYEDGKIKFSDFEDNGNRDRLGSSPTFGLDNFVYLAFTFDDIANEANAYIAADGVSFTNYDTVSTNGSGSDPLTPTIGSSPTNVVNFDGIIDDVRIYNTALTSSEVQQIYNNNEP